jgi:hypothetical protein
MKRGCLLPKKVKGQALSFDFLIACTIFILVIAILLTQVGYNTKELNEIRDKNELIDETHKLSEIFFDEGYPKNWNSSNVVVIGLETDNRISWSKLKSLEEIGYQKSLVLLGLKNDYNITIFENNSTFYSFGKNIENASSIVRVDRVGILNNSIVSVQVLVFDYD